MRACTTSSFPSLPGRILDLVVRRPKGSERLRLNRLLLEHVFPDEIAPSEVHRYPLLGLTARTGDDAAIALLDAWATIADVLTFYQERIANEGYLRTATERRSILELARLVGYTLRPGVAASTYLAYTLERDPEKDLAVVIPKGSRAQSVPGPDERPQPFETAEDLWARSSWNELPVRKTRPTTLTAKTVATVDTLYLAGITTSLKPNDRLLVLLGTPPAPEDILKVESVTPEPAEKRSNVKIQRAASPGRAGPSVSTPPSGGTLDALTSMLEALRVSPAAQPAHSRDLARSLKDLFGTDTDLAPQLVAAVDPRLAPADVYAALANTKPATPAPMVQALGLQAKVFGATAPLKLVFDGRGAVVGSEEWPLEGSVVVGARVKYVQGAPASLELSVVRPGDVVSAEEPLTDLPRTTSVGPATVTISRSDDTRKKELTLELAFTLNGGEGRTITITQTVSTSDIRITFEGASTLHPAPGETLRQATSAGRRTAAQGPVEDEAWDVYVAEEFFAAPGVETRKLLALDRQYEGILPGRWIVIEAPGKDPRIGRIGEVRNTVKTKYNLSASVTELVLDDAWLTAERLLSDVRDVTIFLPTEPSPKLAWEAIPDDVGGTGNTIELDVVCDGLRSGRWIIVSGERTDVAGTTGVQASELAMLAGVRQHRDDTLADDKPRTILLLATPLTFTYRRETVTVWGNVVRATHGETRNEVLGSGNASQSLQSFPLRQAPLTYLAGPTPLGVESTLDVRVDGVRWHETDSLVWLGPTDHAFTTQTDDASKTTVVFGNGVYGARLPSGAENVSAVYRTGIGKPGNVKAGQISQLQSRPLGVKAVVNPLPATGGSDRDGIDQARRNTPLGVIALDRLVSVQDYEDFARNRAGIGKARAVRLADRYREVVHLTIAGAEDIPIDPATSDLFRSLRLALQRYGDPQQPVEVAVRRLSLLVIKARVRVDPDHLWDFVEPMVRSALLDRFGFDRRDLGQDAFLSDVISAVQSVPGVLYVDVDVFEKVPSAIDPADVGALAKRLQPPPKQRIVVDDAAPGPRRGFLAAEIAVLSAAVRDTLILQEIKS